MADMHMEYLKLTPGFRTALADGTLVPDSPKHMATRGFYRAVPGDRIHLCRTGYLFVPAVFSLKRDPVYLYSYAYQPEANWATYTRNVTPDSYGREDYVFEKDCWFRLCVRREDGEALTEKDREGAGDLAAFFSRDIPYEEKPWFTPEIQAVAGRVREAARDRAMKLCVLTDTHYTVNGTWDDTAHCIRSVAEQVHYDAVIHLGDLTDGMSPKDITTGYVNRILGDLDRCQAPVYITPGNHDSNYFRNRQNAFSCDEMRALYRFFGDQNDQGQAPEGEHSINYYVDVPEFSVRMIFLSSFDDQETVRYGYTDWQLVWLRCTMDSAPKGARFLIFSHDAPLARLDYWSFHIRNGERLLDLLEEYNGREDCQVVGLFYGHVHSDYVFQGCSFPVVSTGCAKLEYMLEKKPDGAVTPYREADQVSQELWDSLVIDFDAQKLTMIRFGAGEDREISFKKKGQTYRDFAARERAARTTKIWAHRGASGHAPENTIPAFLLACQMGADGIELDVQLSKDGVPVVIHDERIDRVSDSTGWVRDFTLKQLKALNVNKLFPAYGRVEIPTLAEVYDLMRQTDLTINLELKNTVIFYENLEEKVLALAEEKGLSDRIIYSSFNHYSIRKIQKLNPKAKTAFLCADGLLDVADYGAKYGVCGIHPPVKNVGGTPVQGAGRESGGKAAGQEGISSAYPDVIRQCHEKQIKVHVWAVNERADFERMAALGADAVITDYVERGQKKSTR